ncbi:GTP-binding protein [Actinoplanes sp. NPDC000266]
MPFLNLGVVAHVDAGKTSLTERLLHAGGVTDHVGSVDAGDTQTDSLDLERRRGITIKTAVASFPLGDITVNLIDTPGHPDFIAEVERALRILDGAVLVVSAVEGVQAQTRILMRTLRRLGVPTLIFVNKIDRPGAREQSLLRDLATRLTPDIIPMATVIASGTPNATIRPLDRPDRPAGTTIRPTGTSSTTDPARAAVADFIARLVDISGDPRVLSDWVRNERSVSYGRLRDVLTARTRGGLLHPVFFGSAVTGAGVDELMAALPTLLPATTGTADGPLSGTIFKVDRDDQGRRVAYVRMFSGALHLRDRVPVGDPTSAPPIARGSGAQAATTTNPTAATGNSAQATTTTNPTPTTGNSAQATTTTNPTPATGRENGGKGEVGRENHGRSEVDRENGAGREAGRENGAGREAGRENGTGREAGRENGAGREAGRENHGRSGAGRENGAGGEAGRGNGGLVVITGIEVIEGGAGVRRGALVAGQIGKVHGLREARIGQAIGAAGPGGGRIFAPPALESVVRPRDPADGRRLHVALSELAGQDPLINLRQDGAELSVSLYGEVQKEVIAATLAETYGVEVVFEETRTIHIERPAGVGCAGKTLGKDGNPTLATLELRVEPGSGVTFALEVPVEQVPIHVFKAVELFRESLTAYVEESLTLGLRGWRVTDVHVTATRTGFVSPATRAADFRKLVPLVLREALERAGTVVCEPISRFRLDVPESTLGAVLAALGRYGAVPESSAPLEGLVPTARVRALEQAIPGLTHGEGVLETTFERYDPRPRTSAASQSPSEIASVEREA